LQIYSLQLSFNCEGAPHGALNPVSTHVVQDLKPGEWNRVVWEIPELKRDCMTVFSTGATLPG
jgi:hypothetical protein